MKKNGRPRNFETTEIKEIIDEYVLYTQATVILNASRIAEYAQNNKGYKGFKYYHINRNLEAKEYMDSLNERIKENPSSRNNKIITSFEPIDVPKYLEKTKSQLSKSLIQLNKFMEQLTDNNVELIKQKDEYKRLLDKKSIEIIELRESVKKLEAKNKELEQAYKNREHDLKNKIKNLEKENVDMTEAMRILWDGEAEAILIEEKIFDDNGKGIKINENRVINDLDDEFEKVKRDSKKIEAVHKNKLKGLF